MKVFIVYYTWEPSGPRFSVITANNAREAIMMADEYLVQKCYANLQSVENIRQVDTSKQGISDTAHYCC